MSNERKLIVSEKFYSRCSQGGFDVDIFKIGREYEVIITKPSKGFYYYKSYVVEDLATEIKDKYLRFVPSKRIQWIEQDHPNQYAPRFANRVMLKWKIFKCRYEAIHGQGEHIENLESIHTQI